RPSTHFTRPLLSPSLPVVSFSPFPLLRALPSFPTRRSSDLRLRLRATAHRRRLALLRVPPRPHRCLVHRAGWRENETSVRTRREDRKSTRLNSSHVSISYAVFCLKKKKKQ